MEEQKINEEVVPDFGNPLVGNSVTPSQGDSSLSSVPAQAGGQVAAEDASISAISTPSTFPTTPPAESYTPNSSFLESTTPPTPISSAEGSGSAILSEEAPRTSSHLLGIIIGICLLISVVVGASLYYYFFVFKVGKTVLVEPAPVTLIIDEPNEVQSSSTTLVASTPTPTMQPPQIQSTEPEDLLIEIDNASSSLAISDGSALTFEEDLK